MRLAILGTGVLILACGAAFGQASATPQFEVATVKPTAPSPDGRMFVMMRGGPGSSDPGRVQYAGLTLKNLLSTAYAVKAFQITGPGWLDTERYDIVANVPLGTSKEQFNVMLQNLLAERFKVTLHREKKALPLYELSVGKNGSKLKPAVEDPTAADPGPQGPPPPGKDGLPQLPPGRPNMAMMMGRAVSRVVARVQPVERLADMLGNSLGSIVVDKTGLSGTYDYTLEFSTEGIAGPLGAPLPPPPPPTGGVAGPPGPGAGAPSEYPNIFTAVQEQLGLRLDKKTGPADILVIDHAEKTPTEN
jgi:uncharacterized protein (TIGR03435 family)